MKVVIAGLGKSGTTALFYVVKQAMPRGTTCLFEPPNFDAAGVSGDNIVVKILLSYEGGVDYSCFDRFDKKILIFRDPRDYIVSRALYDLYNCPSVCRDDSKIGAFVGLLRRKEARPNAIPLIEIIDLIKRIGGRDILSRSFSFFKHMVEFQRGHADYFAYRYEDFVRSDLAGIEQYLGLPLVTGPQVVPAEHSRVTRTRTSGDWRNWMTASDVEFFRPRLESYMRQIGYDPDDWTLAPSPSIRSEHASEYVRRIVAERRQGDSPCGRGASMWSFWRKVRSPTRWAPMSTRRQGL